MGRVDELMNLSGRYGSDPDPSPTSTAAPGIGAQLLDLTAATPVKPCTPPYRGCQPRECVRTSPPGYGRI